MTKEDLIFLGVCTIMASEATNFLGGARDRTLVDNARAWAKFIYEESHTDRTIKPPITKFIIETRWDETEKWERSILPALAGIYDSREEANEALEKYRDTAQEYRVIREVTYE